MLLSVNELTVTNQLLLSTLLRASFVGSLCARDPSAADVAGAPAARAQATQVRASEAARAATDDAFASAGATRAAADAGPEPSPFARSLRARACKTAVKRAQQQRRAPHGPWARAPAATQRWRQRRRPSPLGSCNATAPGTAYRVSSASQFMPMMTTVGRLDRVRVQQISGMCRDRTRRKICAVSGGCQPPKR